jgi:branched-chain amino acid transport system ATP-binding protein
MLVVQDLHVSYGTSQVLHGISLQVSAGEIVCVLGPNGAGKSTLMNTLSGLLRQDRGEIILEGSSLDRLSAVTRARLGIVQCPEGRHLFETLTVGENLKLGASRRRLAWRKLTAELDWLVGLFPVLRERWQQQAGTLSGGEQQMVALARSLIARPRVLLLDEPALGLAPRLVRQVFATLPLIARRGVSILLVEQSASAALQVASRGYLLRTGSVVMEGSSEALHAHLEQNAGCLGSSLAISIPMEN